ncbi:MAG: tRNA guanosine(34) transglycosylase Tgt [Candidatus Pacearchaeota archaeon]
MAVIIKSFKVRGKEFELPMFLPDATRGFIRGINMQDALDVKINGLVVNTYHLLKDKLIGKISKERGIHKHINFPGLIVSDSGGFQVMSLIRDFHENHSSYGEFGKISDEGVEFSYLGERIKLTPENCIRLQFLIKSDIIMCLDDCTRPELSFEEQEKSVNRTVGWAKRCKKEFLELTSNMADKEKPLLFGIIQGGNHLELRKKCADALKEIGFDGYAFGGFPVNEKGEFLSDILEYVCELMPEDKVKYAMGIGKPEDIVKCVNMGYDLFDCVIPTREARNNRLYNFKRSFFGFGKLKKLDENGDFYEYVRVRNSRNKDNNEPISKSCNCYTCLNFTKGQIYEMFKKKDKKAIRLTTIHNLRFYTMLMERLRGKYK